jgi:hypothetical protein
MPRRDGGEAILEAFRNLHIDYVISSPGSEWASVWEAFAQQKIEDAQGPFILTEATNFSRLIWLSATR